MLGGAVRSFRQFADARIGFGAEETSHFSTCARVSQDWFNIRQRGIVTGIWSRASSLGTFLALPLLTLHQAEFWLMGNGRRMGAVGPLLAGLITGSVVALVAAAGYCMLILEPVPVAPPVGTIPGGLQATV